MRIIGGNLKSRRIKAPHGLFCRPTADRTKKAVFDILGASVQNATVLDLFAGSGSLGLEALSREAKEVVFVEKAFSSLKAIENNIESLGIKEAIIVKGDVFKKINTFAKEGKRFSLVFMDPPYRKGLAGKCLKVIAGLELFQKDARVIVEHDKRENLPDIENRLTLCKRRKYGDTIVSIYQYEAPPQQAGGRVPVAQSNCNGKTLCKEVIIML